MLFSEVLKAHRSAEAKHSYTDILGDAFLMNENPIYRRIRLQALNLGVSFAEATTQYLLMPFNQLDKILASKQVPFVPSARLMAEVELKHPMVFDLEQMPMPESYHLHESAHIVGEHCSLTLKVSHQEEKILKAILCESFANTVDALACVYAETEFHKVFLRLNCYMTPVDKTRNLINKVSQALGEEFAIRLVLISYVFANFLRDEVPLALIEEWIEKFANLEKPPTKKMLKDCVELGGIGQALDPLFRIRTTENYFMTQGLGGEVYDLLNFDFLIQLRRKDFTEVFEAMISSLYRDQNLSLN